MNVTPNASWALPANGSQGATELFAAGILFDLDGTLVDSTQVVDRNWAAMAKRLHRPAGELVGRFHGLPARAALRLVDPNLDETTLDALAKEFLAAELDGADEVVALPGAGTLLAALPAHGWGIVTSCPTHLALARLDAAGLPRPAVLVTADDVEQGKPHPEPYRTGSTLLGLSPSACVAVEDAPAGITSARAAGCMPLGVLTTHEALDAISVVSLEDVRADLAGSRIQLTFQAPTHAPTTGELLAEDLTDGFR